MIPCLLFRHSEGRQAHLSNWLTSIRTPHLPPSRFSPATQSITDAKIYAENRGRRKPQLRTVLQSNPGRPQIRNARSGHRVRLLSLACLDSRSVQRKGCILPFRRSDLYKTVLLEWEERKCGHAPGYECRFCPDDRPHGFCSCRREQRERDQGTGEYERAEP
jgi:hypothetical protein